MDTITDWLGLAVSVAAFALAWLSYVTSKKSEAMSRAIDAEQRRLSNRREFNDRLNKLSVLIAEDALDTLRTNDLASETRSFLKGVPERFKQVPEYSEFVRSLDDLGSVGESVRRVNREGSELLERAWKIPADKDVPSDLFTDLQRLITGYEAGLTTKRAHTKRIEESHRAVRDVVTKAQKT